MAIGTGALGQYALGQSKIQDVYILPPLLSNSNTIYGFDLGVQTIVASLITNTSSLYQRITLWAQRSTQAETWTERTKQSETWTRR
jgi:hypothetical protein